MLEAGWSAQSRQAMDDDHRTGDGDGGSPDYTAFISYSHRNAEAAKRLHRRLERYRVPGRIRRSFSARKTLRPIFLDRADYRSAGNYTEETELTLRRCGALIVLCTPEFARSMPVNEEIITFKWLGGAESVLPIRLDGEPNATDRGRPDEECFPPSLRHAQDAQGRLLEQRINPIAADARPQGDGPGDAFLKIVAGVLRVPFDGEAPAHAGDALAPGTPRACRWAGALAPASAAAQRCRAGASRHLVPPRWPGHRELHSAGRAAAAASGPRGGLLGWPPAGIDTVLLEAGIRSGAQARGGGCGPEEVSPSNLVLPAGSRSRPTGTSSRPASRRAWSSWPGPRPAGRCASSPPARNPERGPLRGWRRGGCRRG